MDVSRLLNSTVLVVSPIAKFSIKILVLLYLFLKYLNDNQNFISINLLTIFFMKMIKKIKNDCGKKINHFFLK